MLFLICFILFPLFCFIFASSGVWPRKLDLSAVSSFVNAFIALKGHFVLNLFIHLGFIIINSYSVLWSLLRYPMILQAESEGPDQTVHPRSLIWASNARICPEDIFSQGAGNLFSQCHSPLFIKTLKYGVIHNNVLKWTLFLTEILIIHINTDCN